MKTNPHLIFLPQKAPLNTTIGRLFESRFQLKKQRDKLAKKIKKREKTRNDKELCLPPLLCYSLLFIL